MVDGRSSPEIYALVRSAASQEKALEPRRAEDVEVAFAAAVDVFGVGQADHRACSACERVS